MIVVMINFVFQKLEVIGDSRFKRAGLSHFQRGMTGLILDSGLKIAGMTVVLRLFIT